VTSSAKPDGFVESSDVADLIERVSVWHNTLTGPCRRA
jgi:hypothetical protein